ncbi:hypothetical protein VmeM32_00093 [Vibrio phage vB_VmeM-32]|nr:hypothetical protein VmeM32_00093 [Vibrio phage vB_VmeM-32]
MSDINLKVFNNEYAAVLAESQFFDKKQCVRTRLPILNLALSGRLDGGLTSGLTVLAGPSKHFKSNIGLVLVSSYLRNYPDAKCIFFDSEFGSTPTYFSAAGVDINRVIHLPFKNIEELKFQAVKFLDTVKKGDKFIIFIDSVGNSASKKELEDALDEKSVADMTRAKQLKGFFRMVTPYLTMNDVPMVAIAHTYQTQEMYSKTVVSGGCVVEGTQIIMGDGTTKSVEDIEVGEYVKTLVGTSIVTHTWNPDTLEVGEPECYEIEFEDGYKVTCSDKHRFLVMQDDIPVWVEAKNLIESMDCVNV